jgi:hypothetical protein
MFSGQEATVTASYATANRRDESACAPSRNLDCSTCPLACPKAGGRKASPAPAGHDFLFGGDFQIGAGNDLLFGQPA